MIGSTFADDRGFRDEYEYPWPDPAWYSNVGDVDPWLDYAPATDIPSRQGEDFGLDYDPARVGFGQGPDRARTRLLHTRYAFFFDATVGCDPDVSVDCGDLIFASGFES